MYTTPSPPSHTPFCLEAVTVCVGYGDFLATAVEYNQPLFDNWVIVTCPDDSETRRVCHKYGLRCIVSREYKRDNAKFAKGRMINAGIAQLSQRGWMLHLDADMLLPRMTRRLLIDSDLDTQGLYGCDRAMIRSWPEWKQLLNSGYLLRSHESHWRVNLPPKLDICTRFSATIHGYCPLGCFQLFHHDSMYDDRHPGLLVRPYPWEHNDAARSDIQFALQYDRRDRHLLSDLVAIHLESEPAKMGANWKGRKTRRWGG